MILVGDLGTGVLSTGCNAGSQTSRRESGSDSRAAERTTPEAGPGHNHARKRVAMIRRFLRIPTQYARRRDALSFRGRRNCSSYGGGREDTSMEEDAERKIGWLLKSIFAGTAVYFGYQFVPYMGDNLIQQSISLLCVKDPLFKRMGASRISRFATDDERSTKIIEMGGIERLVTMLDGATDDRTRKAALKALNALSHTDAAVKALHEAGAVAIIKSTPNSSDGEVTKYKSNLFKRFQDLKYETPLPEME
ncbi:hypothetical protein EJ110_NYTH04678 [Nymphaea thermarum]|nr:hypothetical protein EJ110_NYTH04678 [Nymphaea thermarum]